MNDQDTQSREQLLLAVTNLQRRVAELEASTEKLNQSEERLRQSEEKYRVIFDNEIYAVGIFDPETRQLLDVNETLTRLYGYSRAELLGGMTIHDLTAETRTVTEATLAGAIQAGTIFVPLRHHRKKDGTIFPVEMVGRFYRRQGRKVMILLVHDITERKRIEEALRESKERLELALKGADLGTWDWYIPDNELIVNERWAEMLGYTLAEIKPHINTWEKLIHPDDVDRVLQNTQANLEGQTPIFQEEYRVRTKSGEWKWIFDTGKVMVRDEQGRPVRAAGIHQDITARKQAEETLRASEARFATIFHASPLGISISRLKDNQLLEVNEAWQTMIGFSREEVIGRTSLELKLWANIGDRERLFRQIREQGPVQGFEAQMRHKSGQEMELLMSAEVIEVAGEPCLLVLSQDISERKQVERIEAAQLAVSQVLAKSPEPTVALRQVLEAIAGQMGWDLAKLWRPASDGSRLVWRDGWRTSDQPELAEFEQVSRGYTFAPGEGLAGAVWQEGQAIWDKGLRLPKLAAAALAAGLHSATGVPIIEDGETRGVMTFFSRLARPLDERLLDKLTDLGRQIGQFLIRKRIEADLADERAFLARRVEERTAELSQANAELTQALQTKDEFLATMSHELRTPLNIILGKAEVLQEETYGPLNERQLKSATVIEQSGRHLLALITDILDFAQAGAGKLELDLQPVSVMEVSQASLTFFNEAATKKNLTLSFNLNDWGVSVKADPQRLKQILINLLGNAVKFTPADGQVSLTVKTDREQKLIHFVVQDSGIGIKAEDIPRLFKPFTQLDARLARQYEGAGLGLALVRQLVELHGGTVGVESEGVPGQGSRFTVSLPLN